MRRLREWLILAGAAGAGGGVGVLAGAWLPAWAAAVVSAAGAGVAGGLTARAQDAIRQTRKSTSELTSMRVRDADDPLLLGVHPAQAATHDGQVNRVPEFVTRDTMARLCERLRLGGFVLLIGESTAGKSRLAYEAMRATLPHHILHRPTPGVPADELVAAVSSGRRHVVWFDEFDLYLGAEGLSVDALRRVMRHRRGRHIVVLATMRVREYDRYSARNRDASDAATWRAGRAVLLLAGEPLEIARAWSERELSQARTASGDARVANALRKASRYGVAEVLAAGPELVDDWQRAIRLGTHPRGAALVSAAVDCRRMGLHRPVSVELLERLHLTYVPRDAPALEQMPEALAWATTVVYGSSSLLLSTAGGYMAFDYLIDLPFLPAVPDVSWTMLVDAVTPAEAYDVGWAAIDLQRSDHALTALARARDHHVPNAEYAHLIALGNAGSVAEAAERLRRIWQERAASLGPHHPDTIQARYDRARYLGESGQTAAAIQELREVIEARTRILGPDAEATLTAREFLARFTGDGGDYATAVVLLDRLAAHQQGLWGPDHLQTLVTRTHAARYTATLGRPAEAAAELAELIARLEQRFGPDVPYRLSARYEHARAVGEAGDPAGAVRLLEDLLTDQNRVLGSRHPRVLSTRHQIARFTGESGDLELAITMLRALVPECARQLGLRHHRTLGARLHLVQFLLRSQAADAPVEAHALHADCATALGTDHPISKQVARLTTPRL